MIGMAAATLYLALIFGEGDQGQMLVAIVWLAFMAAAGLIAWFADRTTPRVGRRMMWVAFAIFFAIGVLSIFTIGILYLAASVLSVVSLSRRPSAAAVGSPSEGGQS